MTAQGICQDGRGEGHVRVTPSKQQNDTGNIPTNHSDTGKANATTIALRAHPEMPMRRQAATPKSVCVGAEREVFQI